MTKEVKSLFLARLATIEQDDPLWVGLTQLIETAERETVAASSSHGLTADDRAFNDGRQAMAEDILGALSDAWLEARKVPEG